MVSKINRLNKNEVSYVMERGKRFRGELFDIKMMDNIIGPKIAVIIAKKVAKKAVTRNKIRRIIKQWFYEYIIKENKNDVMVFILKNSEVENLDTKTLNEFVKLTLNNS